MRNPLLPESNNIEASVSPLHDVFMYAVDNLINEAFSQEFLDDLRTLENFLIEDLKSARITQNNIDDLNNSLLTLLKLKNTLPTYENNNHPADSEEIFYDKLTDFQDDWITITQIDKKNCLSDGTKWLLFKIIAVIWIVSLLSMIANMLILTNSKNYQHTKWHKTLDVIFQVTIGITLGTFAPFVACTIFCCFCNCLFPGIHSVFGNDVDRMRHPRYHQKKEIGEKIADTIQLMIFGSSRNNSNEFNELDTDTRITGIEMQTYPPSRV